MIPVTRDDPDYPWDYEHRPRDHNEQGLYAEGPKGEHCSLARLIELSKLLRITASSPDAERKRRVRLSATQLRAKYTPEELQRRYEADQRRIREGGSRQMWVGGYLKSSGKRPNSGRKRRVAA